MPGPVKTRSRLSPTTLGVALFACAAGAAGTVLAVPRPVAPSERPGLVLDPRAIVRIVAADVRDARSAPDDPASRGVAMLVHVQNEAETHPLDSPDEFRERVARIRETAFAVHTAHGDHGLVQLRAVALAELESVAGHADVPEERRDRILGSFPDVLEHYGVTRRGVLVAPRFVMRTLYKARWNALLQLEPAWQLAPVERRAFHGWLALCAPEVAPADRMGALGGYAAAGGTRAVEAGAIIAWQAADFQRAEERLGRAYVATGSVRLRNYQLAAALEAR